MKLRTLLLSFALAGTACTVAVPSQFPCNNPGATSECGSNQICGNDRLCTTIVACGPGQARCNGNCIDVTTDPNNCGFCAGQTSSTGVVGQACDRAKGEVCQPPTTEGGHATCQAFCFKGQQDCGGTCRDTSTDNSNCGGCGVVCPVGDVCTASGPGGAGQCSLACQSGLSSCGNVCVDTQRDNRNCGTCGNVCPSGQVCGGGTCSVSCPAGEAKCGSPAQCVNTATDRNNCGTCGTVCAAGHVCIGGNCGTLSCPDPLVDCGTGTCINPNLDPGNCGYCAGHTNPKNGLAGKACATGESCILSAGTPTCTLVCPGGQSACPAANPTACVNEGTDPNNCGSCGHACNSGETCTPTGPGGTGQCTVSCQIGLAACTQAGGAIACKDLTQDRSNCGACGNVCGNGQVCSPKASGGYACAASCASPLVNCNGVCTNVVVDPNNCGYCVGQANPDDLSVVGVKCGDGLACGGGACGVACGTGSIACNGGCVDTNNDNHNCGGCTQGVTDFACAAGKICDGTGTCASTCGVGKTGLQLSICPPGSSGRCVDTTSDPANCGACGHSCNSGEVCLSTGPGRSGQCTVSCQSGLTACTQSGGAIACKDLSQDRNNCGTCGTTCGDGQVCAPNGAGGFACATSCPTPPLAGCNGACTNVSADPNNCGWCAGQTSAGGVTGKVCAAAAGQVAFCSGGNCQAACTGGFADCDGIATNGCETDTGHDPLHCGDCKTRCPAPDNAVPSLAACSSGACQSGFVCQAGFQDCDSNTGNGCEANLSSDARNCGGSACGATVCQGSSSFFCSGGACSSTPSGVQQNVLISDLTAHGWLQCSAGDYGSTTSIDSVKTSCQFLTASTWLVGCGTAGTLNVAAAGAPSDVLFATSPGAPHVAAGTGVEWYFDNGTFGFAPAGASVVRGVFACDGAGTATDGFVAGFGSQRLCWLTAGANFVPGQRCGDAAAGDSTLQRFVFYK